MLLKKGVVSKITFNNLILLVVSLIAAHGITDIFYIQELIDSNLIDAFIIYFTLIPIIIRILVYNRENSILSFFLLSGVHFAFDFYFLMKYYYPTSNFDCIDFFSLGVFSSGIFTFFTDSKPIYMNIANQLDLVKTRLINNFDIYLGINLLFCVRNILLVKRQILALLNGYLLFIYFFGTKTFILCYFACFHIPLSIYHSYNRFGTKSILSIIFLTGIINVLLHLILSKKIAFEKKYIWVAYSIVYIHIILHLTINYKTFNKSF